MNVLKQAKVGGYSALLTLQYSKILQMGQLITTITVPFRLTGRVILNTLLENKELIPGSPNILKVNIQNKGTADATGVVATITGVTGSSTTGGSILDKLAVALLVQAAATQPLLNNNRLNLPHTASSSSSIPTVNVGFSNI